MTFKADLNGRKEIEPSGHPGKNIHRGGNKWARKPRIGSFRVLQTLVRILDFVPKMTQMTGGFVQWNHVIGFLF